VTGIANFANTNVTGAMGLSGALSVAGQTTLNGARVTDTLNVIAPLNVTGNATLSGALSVAGQTTTNGLYVDNNSNTDTLTVRQGANIGQLAVSGTSQLSNTTVQGNLTATGSTTLVSANITDAVVEKSLAVNGPMAVTGPVTIAGSSTSGSSFVSGLTETGSLNVRNSAAVGELSVAGSSSLGNTSVAGNLGVSGRTTTASLSAGDIDTSNLRVSGTLTVEGMIDLPRRFSFGEIVVEGQSTLSDTTVSGTFSATNGANTLHFGQDGFKVASGPNGGTITSTNAEASLQHQGSGVKTSSGMTEVSGATRTSVTGGGTTLNFSGAGARLSGPTGGPVRLSGIADGVDRNDAVNLGQLNAGLKQAGYGIAMSMAMAQLPTPRDGSTYSVGIAVGSFDGFQALAVGGSALLGDTAALSASISKAGRTVGGGVGIGWSF